MQKTKKGLMAGEKRGEAGWEKGERRRPGGGRRETEPPVQVEAGASGRSHLGEGVWVVTTTSTAQQRQKWKQILALSQVFQPCTVPLLKSFHRRRSFFLVTG